MPHLLTGPSSSRSPLAVTIGLWMTHSARCVSEAADRIGMARSPLVPAAELSGRIWSGSRLGSGAEVSSDVLAVILLDEGHAPVANARDGSRPRAGWWLSATPGGGPDHQAVLAPGWWRAGPGVMLDAAGARTAASPIRSPGGSTSRAGATLRAGVPGLGQPMELCFLAPAALRFIRTLTRTGHDRSSCR